MLRIRLLVLACLLTLVSGSAHGASPETHADEEKRDCLASLQRALEFGGVPLGCRSIEQELKVYNLCPKTVELGSIVVDSPNFELVDSPKLPLTLAPWRPDRAEGDEGVVRVTVRYVPKDLTSDSGTLTVRGDEDERVALAGAGILHQQVVEELQVRMPRPVDFLFVLDDSPVMAANQARLAENLRQAFRDITSAPHLDFHLAVTTSSVDPAVPEYASGRFQPLGGGRPRVVTRETADAEEAFLANASVGAKGSVRSMFARPAWLALSEPLSNGHNAGFRRKEAALVVVLVAASVDHDKELTSLQPRLRSLFDSADYQSRVLAVIPSKIIAPEGCVYEKDALASNRLQPDILYFLHSETVDVCQPDWGHQLCPSWMAFGDSAQWFQLSSRPSTWPEVWIGGKRLSQESCDWSFSPNGTRDEANFRPDNTLIVRPQRLPRGAKLEVRYETGCR